MNSTLSVPFACALTLVLAAGATAQETRTFNAGDGLYLQRVLGRVLIHESSGEVGELSLPFGVMLNRVDRIERGWIATGVIDSVETTDLFLLRSEGGVRQSFPAPPNPADDPLRIEPVPLVQNGQLVGLAWISGSRVRATAVYASLWSGSDWSPAELVSPIAPGTQIGLTGAILADGAWLLAWSRFDGNDDEIVWSRRRDKRWSEPRSLHRPNDHPDIVPSLVATGSGALAAWSSSDGSTYRVRLAGFDGADWTELAFLGPSASVRPQLTPRGAGATLLYRTVVPSTWTRVELDARGVGLRRAVLPHETTFRPGLVGEAPAFEWPGVDIAEPETIQAEWQSLP